MYRTLSMCPVGMDSKEIDNHMQAQHRNYRLRLERPWKVLNSSFHSLWKSWLWLAVQIKEGKLKKKNCSKGKSIVWRDSGPETRSPQRHNCKPVLCTPQRLSFLINSMGIRVKSFSGVSKGTSTNICLFATQALNKWGKKDKKEDRWLPGGSREVVGWTGSLGLVDANYYI